MLINFNFKLNFKTIFYFFKELTNKIKNLQNVRFEKLRKLRTHFNDAFTAIEWLEQNRNKFHGKIYEPMILLVRVEFLFIKININFFF